MNNCRLKETTAATTASACRRVAAGLGPGLLAVLLAGIAGTVHAADADNAAKVSDAGEVSNSAESPPFSMKLEVDAPSPLRDMLKNGLDIARWQDYKDMTQPLLESLVRDARAQALEAVATEGYFNAKLDATIAPLHDGQRVVRLKLTPGPAAHVSSVSLKLAGLQDMEAGVRVQQQWPLRTGQVFRQPDWQGAKQVALAALSAQRYLGAAVADSQATVDPASNTAALALTLDTGPVFHYGPLSVSGLERYRDTTVTHLAPFKAGAPYAREDVEVFLRRLNATNYFASAQVVIDDNRALAAAAPVRVSVIEAPPRRLEAGLGYSTDTLYRGTAAWRDVNLFDSAWRLRSELRLESKQQQLSTTLALPARADGWTDSFDAAATRTYIENLTTRGVVFGVTRRSIDERHQPGFGASYYFEYQQPDFAPGAFSRALLARFEYSRRTVDDLVFPRSGAVIALQLGASVPGASTRTFGRTVAQVAWFHPWSRQDVISLRAEAGAVLSPTAQGIPQALLFRTGGDTTVRGYSYDSLGVASGTAVVGGRIYALGSTEYTHWFADTWGLAAFVDSGNAADTVNTFNFATGYGLGARVKTPIGPFRLDVARGQQTKEIRLHISVGLAF